MLRTFIVFSTLMSKPIHCRLSPSNDPFCVLSQDFRYLKDYIIKDNIISCLRNCSLSTTIHISWPPVINVRQKDVL